MTKHPKDILWIPPGWGCEVQEEKEQRQKPKEIVWNPPACVYKERLEGGEIQWLEVPEYLQKDLAFVSSLESFDWIEPRSYYDIPAQMLQEIPGLAQNGDFWRLLYKSLCPGNHFHRLYLNFPPLREFMEDEAFMLTACTHHSGHLMMLGQLSLGRSRHFLETLLLQRFR